MANWVTTWAMAHCNIGHFSPSYQDSTMRLSVYNNLNGSALRLRFSNKEGKKPMHIQSCKIGTKQVTFQKNTAVTLAPGQELCSDALALKMTAGSYITVSVAFKGPVISGNSIAAAVQCSPKGDYTAQRFFEPRQPNLNARIFGMEKPIGGISAMEVLADTGKVVACFGDSITQQSKWTEPLGDHLAQKHAGQVSLVNMGIGGNRLLHGPMKLLGTMHGQAGLERFRHDVLSLAGIASVILAIGTNDIGFFFDETNPEYTTAEMVIAGMEKLIAPCRERNIKVFGSTILPRSGLKNYKPNQEAERVKLNAWLRSCGLFDGVFDFDAAVRDPEDASRLQFAFDSGDHLHPSAQGGKELFRCIVETLNETGVDLF